MEFDKYGTYLIKNPLKYDIEVMFDGELFLFPAGKKEPCPVDLAIVAARRIIDKLILENETFQMRKHNEMQMVSGRTTDRKLRDKYLYDVVELMGTVAKPATLSAGEKARKEMEELRNATVTEEEEAFPTLDRQQEEEPKTPVEDLPWSRLVELVKERDLYHHQMSKGQAIQALKDDGLHEA